MTRALLLQITLITALSASPAIAADAPPAEAQPLTSPTPLSIPAPTAAAPQVTIAPAPQETKSGPYIPSRLRIGYADLLKIGTESTPGKAGKVKFEKQGAKLKSKIDARAKQLEKDKKALEEKFPTLTPDQRAAKAKEFDKKVDDYRKMVQKAQSEMEPLQRDISNELYGLMEKAAADYGKKNGLAVIVPKKELLFIGDAVETIDVTDELMKLVNEMGKEKK